MKLNCIGVSIKIPIKNKIKYIDSKYIKFTFLFTLKRTINTFKNLIFINLAIYRVYRYKEVGSGLGGAILISI